MIGQLGRKYLSRHSEPAVDKGESVSATYQLSKWPHVDSVRIERLIEQLVNQLVTISSASPGAGPASALGLTCGVEHGDGHIIVTLSLNNDGRDRGCH